MALLSVLLPVFNCEKYVGRAIESILSQTFTDFELLIADDGSTDFSMEIINDYSKLDSRIRVSNNVTNQGKVKTTNRLLLLSAGKYVTVHDADDVSDFGRFDKQIGLLEKNKLLLMCGTSFRMVTASGRLFKEVIMPRDFNDISKDILYASQFHGPTMVIRRESIGNCLYRTFFNDYNEDCDLAFRLIEKGPCTNLREILYTYRILPTSLSKSVTAEKKNFYKMAVAFHEQRKVRGTDDLMDGNFAMVEERLRHFVKAYHEDPSLIHRENAAFLMYYELNTAAILNAWKACFDRPFYFKNWRTLQYCVRKTLLGV